MTQIDIASASFRRMVYGDLAVDGVRPDGSSVLVATVDPEFPRIAEETADALEALGVDVDRTDLPTPCIDAPTIHFATMRVSTGPDGSDWTDLETRSSLGKYPSASFAEEFDAVAERVAALHPRPPTDDSES